MTFKAYLKRADWFRRFRFSRLRRQLSRALPDWAKLLSPQELEQIAQNAASGNGPRVLIATSVGMHQSINTLDSLLAVALAVRGARVEILLCDGTLPACMVCESNWFQGKTRFIEAGPREFCRMCPTYARRMYDALGLTVRTYSEFLTQADYRQAADIARTTPYDTIPGLVLNETAIGDQALSGCLRYFARSDLDGEADGEAVLRLYLQAAVLAKIVGERVFADQVDIAVLHHGIYVPQGCLADTARRTGTRVVTWNPAYRKGCFIFSHDDTYHHTLMDEPVSAWEGMAWPPQTQRRIQEYLASRWHGKDDWITFNRNPSFDPGRIKTEFGLDDSRPIVVLLTNVAWDAQLHYPANAYATMLDWIKDTITYFASRPDLQLVVRVHPAEVSGSLPSRQRVTDELARAFPRLPDNVKIVPPEHPASSYVIADMANAALIYGTKMGVELAGQGLPVIVAGEAWVRNKGITLDASSRTDYLALLGRLPFAAPLTDDLRDRANRYAFHFFFRRMIHLDRVIPTDGWPPFLVGIDSLADLAPGASRGLDVICCGILEGTPFIDRQEGGRE